MDKNKMKSVTLIAGFAKKYKDEYLSVWKNSLKKHMTSWLDSFDFFLLHIYAQGRNDTLSTRYWKAAVKALSSYFRKDQEDINFKLEKAWKNNWIPHAPVWDEKDYMHKENQIWEQLAEYRAGKQRDQLMVLDALRFIYGIPDHNIIPYTIQKIKTGQIEEHFNEIDSIYQVGEKTASFYLRDTCMLYNLDELVKESECVFPIDTWVEQICKSIGVADETDDKKTIRLKILKLCSKTNIKPSDFNAGAWYCGKYSYDLMLDILTSVDSDLLMKALDL